ncbi:EutN/CcmL family microcompartment protein [bacterium]|nr:EutN/CcmL family microcompartment protein [bacterium]
MIYGIIKGTVVASHKNGKLKGMKLLVVQPLDLENKPLGKCILASDSVQAGPGDRVIVNREGGGANKVMGLKEAPIASVVVGIVDSIEIDKKYLN